MRPKQSNKDSKISGAVGTILFHALLLLCMYFGYMFTLPPEEEEGLTVNYGFEELGEGMFEPAPQEAIEEPQEATSDPVEPAVEPVPSTPSVSEDDLQTQDIEESIEVKQKREEEERKKQEEINRKKEEERQKKLEEEKKRQEEAERKRKEEEERKRKEEQRQKAQNAAKNAFGSGGKGTSSTSSSQGNTGGTGNQGNPFGDVNSNSYQGGGQGNGNSYNLGGRSLVGALPKPSYKKNEQGVIVVTIEVNAAGTVISAKAGAQGTTIGDKELRRGAEEAALKAKFSKSNNTIQQGTITYRYNLN